MNTKITFFIIFIAYIFGFIFHAILIGKTVYGDGIYYYSWTRSLTIDRDTNFENEYAHFQVSSFTTPIGLKANKYGVGTAILWLPLFAQTHAVIQGDGYTLPYQLSTGLFSVLMGITGLVFVYLTIASRFTNKIANYTVFGIAFATNLWYYGSLDVINSHAAGFFVAALMIYVLTHTEKNVLFIGVLTGILTTIRFQDVLFSLLPLTLLPNKSKILFLVGLIMGFLPQLVAWKALYGSWIFNSYGYEKEYFLWTNPHVFQILFSPKFGLFLTTPLLILSVILLVRTWSNKYIYKIAILIIILEIYLVSSWSTWWQGATYGGRMFVSSLPLFALGLGELYKKWQNTWHLFIFSGMNAIIILIFLLSQ